MAKVRLTKNELKKQKDNLKRYLRYLPTLELKKKQLLVEIRRIQNEIERLREEDQRAEQPDIRPTEGRHGRGLQIQDRDSRIGD